MQNLSEAEETEWLRRCEHQRLVAAQSPCYVPEQSYAPCYGFHLGPWNCWLTLDRFRKPPKWHASLSITNVVREDRVTNEDGVYLFHAPQPGILKWREWPKDDYALHKEMFQMIFGPLAQKDTLIEVNLGGQLTVGAFIVAMDS